MATRDAADIERLRVAQGEQFLKQMSDMFQQTRVDLATQFVPRAEMEHINDAVERVANAVEKLTNNVSNFHEAAPRIFADRADTKQDIAELRTEIEKLKTAREADMQRGFGWRYEDAAHQYAARYDDQSQRFQGEARGERAWRANAQQQGNQALTWVIGISVALLTIAMNVIMTLMLRH